MKHKVVAPLRDVGQWDAAANLGVSHSSEDSGEDSSEDKRGSSKKKGESATRNIGTSERVQTKKGS